MKDATTTADYRWLASWHLGKLNADLASLARLDALDAAGTAMPADRRNALAARIRRHRAALDYATRQADAERRF